MNWNKEWHYLAPMSLLVVCLNIIAIMVTLKTKNERRKSTTALISSLLTSDLLIGAIVLPCRIVEIWYHRSPVFGYIYAYFLLLSALNTLYLSLDRYTSVMHPLWRRLLRTSTILKGLVITWSFPCLLSLLPLAWQFSGKSNGSVVYAYFFVCFLCVVIIAVVVLQLLVMCGLLRYWAAFKRRMPSQRSNQIHSRNLSAFAKKHKSTLICTCLIFSTMLTWLPTIILNLYYSDTLVKISLFSILFNSAIDPIVIIAFNSSVLGLCTKLITTATSTNSSRCIYYVSGNESVREI